MYSLSTTIADLLPYMFAAVGLEVLSNRIRKLKERVGDLEDEIKHLKVSELSSPRFNAMERQLNERIENLEDKVKRPKVNKPLSPHFEAMERQKERTRQFLEERERRQHGSQESGPATR